MTSKNKIEIIGRAGKDPEIRHTGSGAAVTTFSVATSERWKDKTSGEWQERTEWHSCVAWAQLAERVSERLRKGMFVLVEGKMQYRSYEDKNGAKRDVAEIVVSDFMTFEKHEGGERSEAKQEQVPEFEVAAGPENDDDLPF